MAASNVENELKKMSLGKESENEAFYIMNINLGNEFINYIEPLLSLIDNYNPDIITFQELKYVSKDGGFTDTLIGMNDKYELCNPKEFEYKSFYVAIAFKKDKFTNVFMKRKVFMKNRLFMICLKEEKTKKQFIIASFHMEGIKQTKQIIELKMACTYLLKEKSELEKELKGGEINIIIGTDINISSGLMQKDLKNLEDDLKQKKNYLEQEKKDLEKKIKDLNKKKKKLIQKRGELEQKKDDLEQEENYLNQIEVEFYLNIKLNDFFKIYGENFTFELPFSIKKTNLCYFLLGTTNLKEVIIKNATEKSRIKLSFKNPYLDKLENKIENIKSKINSEINSILNDNMTKYEREDKYVLNVLREGYSKFQNSINEQINVISEIKDIQSNSPIIQENTNEVSYIFLNPPANYKNVVQHPILMSKIEIINSSGKK